MEEKVVSEVRKALNFLTVVKDEVEGEGEQLKNYMSVIKFAEKEIKKVCDGKR